MPLRSEALLQHKTLSRQMWRNPNPMNPPDTLQIIKCYICFKLFQSRKSIVCEICSLLIDKYLEKMQVSIVAQSQGESRVLLAVHRQLDKSASQILTHKHAGPFSEPYIFISGYLIRYAGRDWADCAHSCISITDHIRELRTVPLLIFTQSIQNNGPFLGSFFSLATNWM